ncbi:hypothetical protein [Nocardia transvalensis]|uniref:hypothetical protein n=1 Tax=Nocardia transvalensis TaxID=37333 RepID=UPI001895BBDD|nr:hypothetical protein [Nocardia transvalensis]MBF6333047.1 hypothetical protein [Nocardia transvalensis]
MTGGTRVLAPVVLAACVAFAGACSDGSGGGHTTHSSSPTVATATADTPPIPVPSAGDLNAAIKLGLDPTVPLDRKSGWIQGIDVDPELADRVANAVAQNHIQMTVARVDYRGDGQAVAYADLTVNGEPVQGQSEIPFVVDGNRWKVKKEWACYMLSSAQVQSPACAS